MLLEDCIRNKIDALYSAQRAGKIKGLDGHNVVKLYERSVATKKGHYPLGLDLQGMQNVEQLHKTYCH